MMEGNLLSVTNRYRNKSHREEVCRAMVIKSCCFGVSPKDGSSSHHPGHLKTHVELGGRPQALQRGVQIDTLHAQTRQACPGGLSAQSNERPDSATQMSPWPLTSLGLETRWPDAAGGEKNRTPHPTPVSGFDSLRITLLWRPLCLKAHPTIPLPWRQGFPSHRAAGSCLASLTR